MISPASVQDVIILEENIYDNYGRNGEIAPR
jgi:hypothetical protein